MAENIEAFVARLQAEGVQAGQEAAEKIRAEAREQAEQALRQAADQAGKIVQDARTEARRTAEKARTELELAARDIVLRLRDRLGRALRVVLAGAVRERLSDPDFLGALVRDVVLQYAQADSEHKDRVTVNVPPDMRQRLLERALAELAPQNPNASTGGVDLRADLKEAGFEYRVGGSAVEVTVDSVVGLLGEMIGPDLREVLEKAMTGESAPQKG